MLTEAEKAAAVSADWFERSWGKFDESGLHL